MQTQPIRATASKARTREEIFAVETSTGAADKYFRIGPGGQAHLPGRSLPLSNGCRLTLHPCCEWKYRSPPDDERACRAKAAASWARRHSRRGCEFRGPEGRATGSEISTAKQPVVNRQPAMDGSDEFVINHKEKNPRSRSSEDLMLMREGKKHIMRSCAGGSNPCSALPG